MEGTEQEIKEMEKYRIREIQRGKRVGNIIGRQEGRREGGTKGSLMIFMFTQAKRHPQSPLCGIRLSVHEAALPRKGHVV